MILHDFLGEFLGNSKKSSEHNFFPNFFQVLAPNVRPALQIGTFALGSFGPEIIEE